MAMEKSEDVATSGRIGDVPTPLRRVFDTARAVFDTGATPKSEEVRDEVEEEVEDSCSWSLFSTEQCRAHRELVHALAAQLSEGKDAIELSDVEASYFLRCLQNFAAPAAIFVIALFVLTPIALFFATSTSQAIVAHPPMQFVNASQATFTTATPPSASKDLHEVVSTSTPPVKLRVPKTTKVTATPPSIQTAQAKPSNLDVGSRKVAPVPATSIAEATASLRIDTIGDLLKRGRFFLQHSRCHEAEPLFGNALRLLDEELARATKAGKAAQAINRNAIVKDQAFAMICMLRFDTGARLMDQIGLNSSSMHMNALGYARFKLKDYRRASAAFEMGLRTDPLNKLMWNNLAAAKLLTGDIKAADEAMYNALDPDNHYFQADPWFNQIFYSNVNVIMEHAMGRRGQHPAIEMWYSN